MDSAFVGDRLNAALRFAEDLEPPLWDPSSPDIEVWRDNRGQACAYGQLVDGRSWLRVIGIGDFRLDPGGTTLVVSRRGAVRADVIDTYYRSVLPMALQLAGLEVLHASAVVLPQGVIALCAVSETGKSTLAYGLSRRGHELYADDAVAFDATGSHPLLIQIPFALRLRPTSADHFGEPSRDFVRVIGPQPARPVPRRGPAAICVLERLDGQQPGKAGVAGDETAKRVAAVERLSPAAAFAAVLPHAYCFSLSESDRKRRMMQHYLSLARQIPVLRLGFRSGLDHLPEILDTLEGALFEHCSSGGGPPREDQMREKLTLR